MQIITMLVGGGRGVIVLSRGPYRHSQDGQQLVNMEKGEGGKNLRRREGDGLTVDFLTSRLRGTPTRQRLR